ncbi:MAG TPA: hypothetical protein VLA16_13405, partial [Ideonella sp.]|nr:hypothetical protein [Ideonella sp.]
MPPPSPSSFPAIDLSACASGDAGWAERVQALQTWAQARAVDLRDAVWLLPFSALLPPARRALAACGGWQPRVETPATLVTQLAPALAQAEGALGGDAVTNRLQAAALLRQQAWGAAWARRDPRAFAQGV